MIWSRWAETYNPKWNATSKWATDDERVLEVGDLVWLLDESVRQHENKMARVIEVFPGADGVIRSVPIGTGDEKLRRPAVKLAPVFYECFRDENRAGVVGARDSKNNISEKFSLRKFRLCNTTVIEPGELSISGSNTINCYGPNSTIMDPLKYPNSH